MPKDRASPCETETTQGPKAVFQSVLALICGVGFSATFSYLSYRAISKGVVRVIWASSRRPKPSDYAYWASDPSIFSLNVAIYLLLALGAISLTGFALRRIMNDPT